MNLSYTHVDTLPRSFYRLGTNKLKHGRNYRACVAVDVFRDYTGEPSIEIIFMYGGHAYSLVGNGAALASFPRVGEIAVATVWSVLPVVWSESTGRYVSREHVRTLENGNIRVSGLYDFPEAISCVERPCLQKSRAS